MFLFIDTISGSLVTDVLRELKVICKIKKTSIMIWYYIDSVDNDTIYGYDIGDITKSVIDLRWYHMFI